MQLTITIDNKFNELGIVDAIKKSSGKSLRAVIEELVNTETIPNYHPYITQALSRDCHLLYDKERGVFRLPAMEYNRHLRKPKE